MSGIGGLLVVCWWFGRPVPRRWALRASWALPLAVALAFGAGPGWRVAHRVDDGDRGERTIEGNGVRLTWAPAGPGWPGGGASWDEAVRVAAHLSRDGTRVQESPQEYWRLPTRDEVVRSMVPTAATPAARSTRQARRVTATRPTRRRRCGTRARGDLLVDGRRGGTGERRSRTQECRLRAASRAGWGRWGSGWSGAEADRGNFLLARAVRCPDHPLIQSIGCSPSRTGNQGGCSWPLSQSNPTGRSRPT